MLNLFKKIGKKLAEGELTISFCTERLKWRIKCMKEYRYRMFPSIRTQIKLILNSNKENRMLEMGPGGERINGFETLNITPGRAVDYVVDAAKKLPFHNNVFKVVYASHILEHIPWYQTSDVLKEWIRILVPGGRLEVCVPDGLKICKTLVEYEELGVDNSSLDGLYRFNEEKELCKWASSRLLAYANVKGKNEHVNWHKAIFTPRYMIKLLTDEGLTNVRLMYSSEVRGHNHGWINLGVLGIKK